MSNKGDFIYKHDLGPGFLPVSSINFGDPNIYYYGLR